MSSRTSGLWAGCGQRELRRRAGVGGQAGGRAPRGAPTQQHPRRHPPLASMGTGWYEVRRPRRRSSRRAISPYTMLKKLGGRQAASQARQQRSGRLAGRGGACEPLPSQARGAPRRRRRASHPQPLPLPLPTAGSQVVRRKAVEEGVDAAGAQQPAFVRNRRCADPMSWAPPGRGGLHRIHAAGGRAAAAQQRRCPLAPRSSRWQAPLKHLLSTAWPALAHCGSFSWKSCMSCTGGGRSCEGRARWGQWEGSSGGAVLPQARPPRCIRSRSIHRPTAPTRLVVFAVGVEEDAVKGAQLRV